MFKPLLATLALTLGASAANAAITVDQSSVATPGAGQVYVFGPAGRVQAGPSTFASLTAVQFVTAGISGGLAGVDLQIARGQPAFSNGQVTLTIAKNVVFDEGVPVSIDFLGTIDFNVLDVAPGAPGLFSVNTSALGIYLNAGEQFAIALGGADGIEGGISWVTGTAAAPYTPGNPFTGLNYAGGGAYRSATLDGAEEDGPFVQLSATYGFRTLMDDSVAAPVPEPGEWAMMAAGLGVAGLAARRRRRHA